MAIASGNEIQSIPGAIDLAAEKIGGRTIVASDEFFAEKENLLKPGRGIFIPDKFTDRGKWMDGWETRRKRTAGHDWCIVAFGIPGIVKGVDIDTNHFLGNNPDFASLEVCEAHAGASANLLTSSDIQWVTILPKSPLQPGAQNIFPIADSHRWTHARLNILPDGGVARLRIYGEVVPDWSQFKKGKLIDLASIKNGGMAVGASDMFFSPMNNLLMPGRAATMANGWETRRRRGPGNDWVLIRLGRGGKLKKIEIDTNHFKGNYPDTCSIDGCTVAGGLGDGSSWSGVPWKEILPKTKLHPNKQHYFEKELADVGSVTHIRLNIFPDGGVSRLRAYGVIDE